MHQQEATVRISHPNNHHGRHSLVSSYRISAPMYTSCPSLLHILRLQTTYSSMNPTIPPMSAPIPPTLTTSAPPVNVATPPVTAPVPVACGGAEPVAFLAVLVNAGVVPVAAREVDGVMVGTAEVGTRVAAREADEVMVGTAEVDTRIAEVELAAPAGTVLLAWKPAERVMPWLDAQLTGESPCWDVSWGFRGCWRCG